VIEITDAIFHFFAITSIIWMPLGLLRLCSKKLYAYLDRKVIHTLGIIGIPLHEISHMIACMAMGHRITGFSLYSPALDGSMGYVNHRYRKTWLSPLALLVIGLAPLCGAYCGIAITTYVLRPDLIEVITNYSFSISNPHDIWVTTHFLLKHFLMGDFLESILWILVCFSIALFGVPSKSDFRGCRSAVLLLAFVFIAIALLSPNLIYHVAYVASSWLVVAAIPLYLSLFFLFIGCCSVGIFFVVRRCLKTCVLKDISE